MADRSGWSAQPYPCDYEDSHSMKNSEKSGFFKSLFGGEQEVPPRAAVPLYIPIPVTKAEKETLPNIEAMWNQVTQQRLGPLLLLQEVNRYLDKINLMPLPYEQRTRMSNILLNEVATAIGSLFARFFQQGGGIPETREQRDSISHAVRAAEQLAISYKLLFRQDWADPAEDRDAQDRLLLVVLRILECIRLEQLLRAFRYQKLPQNAWRDSNQLFFALRDDWDVEANFPLKIRFSVEDSASRLELFPKMASVQQLYLSIQLTGMLDVISWPVQFIYRVGRYLSEIEAPMIVNDDKGEEVPPGHILVYRNQGARPSFSRGHEQLDEALFIELNPLVRRVTQDRAALVSPLTATIASETLRATPEQDRIPFLDLLLHRLQPQQRRDTRQRVFDDHRARVYGGFEAVYRLFRDITRHEMGQEEVVKERHFWDSLAEHTSIFADGGDALPEPRWLIADDGPGGMQLRQHERDYSMPLYVGRLVAYSKGGEDIGDSRLGYVVRIERSTDAEVEVAIARLREKVKAAVVQDLDSMDQRTVPALLIRDLDGKLQLLCDNEYKFITGERLAVVNDDHHYTGALGEIVLAQADFTVFELHTAE